MIRRASLILALLGTLCALVPAGASAAPDAAAWKLSMTPIPANFSAGATSTYLLVVTNVGAAPTTGETKLEAVLPSGLKPLPASARTSDERFASKTFPCEAPAGQSISCKTSEALHPSQNFIVLLGVEVLAPGAQGEVLTAHASVEGGGAPAPANAESATPITTEPVPFDFLPGFSAPASEADGSAATRAASHPYQLTVDLGFPTEIIGKELVGTEHPRDLRVDLPRGLLGNPAAIPAQCTEAELTSEDNPGCPAESQAGTISVTSTIEGLGSLGVATSPLYNMVPPPGAVAEFGFNAVNVGIFIHLIAHVRSGEDYGAYGTSNDLLALGRYPIFGGQAQLWGDPSGESHRWARGVCFSSKAECKVNPQQTPFLTMPGDCPGEPLAYKALVDGWEQPGVFHEARYESASLQGAPYSIDGCGELEYKPGIQARPTTNVTDSPSGLEFALHQPQQEPEADPLANPATAILKDATVTLPPRFTVNPAQASGLGACSEGQVGFQGKDESGVLRFTEEAQSCPDAARIGSFEASSPLLAEYNEQHEVEHNSETGAPLPRPLHGSLYLAQPFANPFGSLVATYFVVEDPETGVVAKLAGEGELDAATGQLTVRVKESPELPIEDIRVHVFGGDRGSFITPPTCTPQETGAELTPWSAPEAPVAHANDSFKPTAAPGGSACPATEAEMPNAPVLKAGTLIPQAGKYSPLTFKLSRNDGSQRLARVDTTFPSGLIAKLAGVGQCSDAAIAKAISREHPNQGVLEQADPSCPASSEIGTVDIAVGAGPSPFRTSGHVYLAGPYKGAPLSAVVIAPAVAGPFDLGAVVVRATITLEPETALARTVTDPLPQILDGIPVDLRSATLHLSRSGFVLNPTSCNEKQWTGTATSALGQAAPLSERFQVGGCRSLPYKPKLGTRLFGPTHRGGHPRLRAVFTAKPGEANTKRISFALPHSEFIDQAHFRTICTRVQFAAHACPAGSVYGNAKVLTPLLDTPLEGPVYLRSSSHPLPDAVFALHGPPSEPVEVVLDGRIDSVNGGVRVTFPSVPDAPLTKAIVNMQGGKKGLFQNSTNICAKTQRVTLKLDAQNGKTQDIRPRLRAKCPKHR